MAWTIVSRSTCARAPSVRSASIVVARIERSEIRESFVASPRISLRSIRATARGYASSSPARAATSASPYISPVAPRPPRHKSSATACRSRLSPVTP